MEKICSSCKNLLSLDKFHNLKTGKFGKHSHCKICRNSYRKKLNYKKPKEGKMKCLKCNELKYVDCFYKDRSSTTGLQTYCKNCQKEKIYESQSKFEKYINLIFNKFKIYCNKNNFTLNLTIEDINEIYLKQNKKCALCNELLTYYIGKKLTENNYESKFNICISKIDNTKFVNKNNIQLIGKVVYKMKNELTNKEFLRLINLIK